MNTPTQQSFYRRSLPTDGQPPFSGDVLGDRAAIAARLTAYLPGFLDGCVFAIDGPWGSGKTWFGRNWQRQLLDSGFPSARLDAFADDYSDDPFILIAAAISRLATSEKPSVRKDLKEKAIAVGKAMVPMMAKLAISIVINKTIGADTADSVKDAIDDAREDAEEAAEKYLKDRFVDHDQQHRTVEAYRQSLAAFTSRQTKPVVFFVDELDRCRPDFAVRLVERIKHFFDVPNLIFVLLLNRSQLEEAIRGLYGQGVDANGYLGKFVQFSVTLPTPSLAGSAGVTIAHSYCLELARRHSYPNNDMTISFVNHISALAPMFRLSLRDLERAFILLGISGIRNPDQMGLLAYLIALKIGEPEQFRQIAAGDGNAHQIAMQALDRAKGKSAENAYLHTLSALHQFHAHAIERAPSDIQMPLMQLVGSRRPNDLIGDAIERIVSRIDLLVSN